MIHLLLSIASLALRVLSLALLAYCVMSFIMPQSEWYRKLASLVEPVLHPVRRQLYSWFPALGRFPVDFSPLALWLLMDIAGSLIGAIGRMF